MNSKSNSFKFQWTDPGFGIIFLIMLILLTSYVITINFSSKFTPILLVLFVGMLILAGRQFMQLLNTSESNRKMRHSKIFRMLTIGGLSLFIGAIGYVLELYTAARLNNYSGLFGILTTIIDQQGQEFEMGITRILRFNSLMMLAVYISIIAGSIWFFFHNKLKNQN